MIFESDGSVHDAERLAMLAALLDGDVALAYRFAVELLAQGISFDDIMVDVLSPVQTEVGRRWAAGDLSVADEHAASAAVDDLLVRLGAVSEIASGPAVVVACPANDTHALGGRLITSALALEGYRVVFLGASVPARDLSDFLESQRPLALALSSSTTAALVGVSRSVAAAHDLGIPVVGGGRALTTHVRATRLGIDALASKPRDAIGILRTWEVSPPAHLLAAPDPIPEHRDLVRRGPVLATAACETSASDTADTYLREELNRVIQVVESSLLVAEPELLEEHVRWLHDTSSSRGLAHSQVEAALRTLADAMSGDLQRAGSALRAALN